ncbi:MAG TPA: hypothetical protein VE860_04715 [Chthoniobacterales bacterium]|nr:hypothetical protein [Chthoniobacterales bacterium]
MNNLRSDDPDLFCIHDIENVLRGHQPDSITAHSENGRFGRDALRRVLFDVPFKAKAKLGNRTSRIRFK